MNDEFDNLEWDFNGGYVNNSNAVSISGNENGNNGNGSCMNASERETGSTNLNTFDFQGEQGLALIHGLELQLVPDAFAPH